LGATSNGGDLRSSGTPAGGPEGKRDPVGGRELSHRKSSLNGPCGQPQLHRITSWIRSPGLAAYQWTRQVSSIWPTTGALRLAPPTLGVRSEPNAEAAAPTTTGRSLRAPRWPFGTRAARPPPWSAPLIRGAGHFFGPGSGLSSQEARACHARNVRAGRGQATLSAGARFQRGRPGPRRPRRHWRRFSGEQGNL